jgi:hypothetical protein
MIIMPNSNLPVLPGLVQIKKQAAGIMKNESGVIVW